MREMKDSGIEWIGEIPKEWKIDKIKYHLKRNEPKNHGNAIVLSVYRDYGVIPKDSRDDNHNVTSEDTSKYKYVKKGQLVINKMKAWQGSLAVSDYNGIVSPAYFIYDFTDEEYNHKYFHYLVRSCYKGEFKRISGGIREGQWDLSPEAFANTLALLPPLVEQKYIANYLDIQCSEIDATAEDIQKEISLLEDYKKSVITEAVTKGLNPDAEMKDSGIEWIGEIPKGWKIIRLKYITNSIGDGLHGTPNYDDLGTIFFINGNNLGNRKISITEKTNRLTEKEYKKCGVLKLDKRTLLMSLNGTYGTLSMYDNEPIMLSKSVGYINVCNKETKEYLYYFLQSPLAQSQMKISLAGTTIANLSLATVRNLKICLPSICEQQQIADFLDSKCSEIDAIIADKKRQRGILADYKKSLIYEYVTGKKEVPVHE